MTKDSETVKAEEKVEESSTGVKSASKKDKTKKDKSKKDKSSKSAKTEKSASKKDKSKDKTEKSVSKDKSKKDKDKSKKDKGKKDAPAKKKAERDQFGFRKNSKRSEAAKLYSTKKGATLNEIKEKTGSSQLNLLTELEGKGFKIERTKEKGKGKKEVTRYKIVVPA